MSGSTQVEEVPEEAPDGAPGGRRAPRADWVRNRARILEAAEEVFGSEGLTVPVDRIAERAGVGAGTLYRHFPTKEALFVAIVQRHFERLAEIARVEAATREPADALLSVLQSLVSLAVDKRDLADAIIGAGIEIKEAAGETKAELDALLESLLVRAQAGGTIRPDVSYADLMGLVAGSCLSNPRVGASGASPVVMVAVICDGLRTEGTAPTGGE